MTAKNNTKIFTRLFDCINWSDLDTYFTIRYSLIIEISRTLGAIFEFMIPATIDRKFQNIGMVL